MGSYLCQYSGIKSMIENVKDDSRNRLFLLGDLIEAITTDDKRFTSDTQKIPIPSKQKKEAIEYFRPIKKQIEVVLGGNHELKLHRYGNLAEEFADEMGAKYGTRTARVVFMNKGRVLFRAFMTHDVPIFKSKAKDFLQKQANILAAMKASLQDRMGDAALMVCVSNDTEILTDDGWKGIGGIDKSIHQAITMNLNTGHTEKQKINRVVINEAKEDLYTFKNSVVDISVTGEHNLITHNGKTLLPRKKVTRILELPTGVYKKRNKFNAQITRLNKKVYAGPMFDTVDEALEDYYNHLMDFPLPTEQQWDKVKAVNVINKSQITVPISAVSGNSEYDISDDMIKLCGYLISDGHFRRNRKNMAINIYQRLGNENPIEDVLNNLGITHSRYLRKMNGRKFICPHSGKQYETKHDLVTFYIPVEQSTKIAKYIKNKRIPMWVSKLSDRQFNVLLESLVYGDGTWAAKNHSGRYYTSDKQLADDLQIACVTHGWKASILGRKGGYEIGIHKQLTNTLALRQIPDMLTIKKNSERTWCITVENGTIFTRRNGKVAIVGNCGHPHQLLVIEPAPILYLTDGEKGVKQHYLKGDLGNGGYINPDQRWYGCAGSFRKKFVDSIDDYADIYDPVELGYLICEVRNGGIQALKKVVV